jgi:hypothetical protein
MSARLRTSLLLGLLLPFTLLAETNVTTLIRSVAAADAALRQVPFSEVILAAAGRKVLALDRTNAADSAIVKKIGSALDRRERRINEASRHFEDAIREELNQEPGFRCETPRTAAGREQRSGYPDMRLLDQASGRILYLDPKLHEAGSRNSSLRTFYFEPKTETGKVLDDAVHLLVGIEHDGAAAGQWIFLRWELIDLSGLKLEFKAEFQAGNRELYRDEAVVGRSSQHDSSKSKPGTPAKEQR